MMVIKMWRESGKKRKDVLSRTKSALSWKRKLKRKSHLPYQKFPILRNMPFEKQLIKPEKIPSGPLFMKNGQKNTGLPFVNPLLASFVMKVLVYLYHPGPTSFCKHTPSSRWCQVPQPSYQFHRARLVPPPTDPPGTVCIYASHPYLWMNDHMIPLLRVVIPKPWSEVGERDWDDTGNYANRLMFKTGRKQYYPSSISLGFTGMILEILLVFQYHPSF